MVSTKELRAAFAEGPADALAGIAGAGFKRLAPGRGRTARAVWYEQDGALMGVVGDQEKGDTDRVLAHGLHLAEGRSLRLVLPAGWAGPTRHRIPWLTAEIRVFTHQSGHNLLEAPALTQAQTRGEAGGSERSPWPHFGQSGDWVRGVSEWATANNDLDAGHTRSVRGWSCQGQRVLRIQGRRTLKITAGIDATSDQAFFLPVTGPLTDSQVAEVKQHVEAGIADAQGNKFGAFEEHQLQGILRREPGLLRLEHPLLRELPAWRPVGGKNPPKNPLGRGYIDLVGLDPAGDITLVETKLGDDDMLVLQGLDYWIWATREENREWLAQRLNADRDRALVRLLYGIGGKSGTAPSISTRSQTLLEHLDPAIPWRIALLHDWNTDQRHGQLLDPQRTPDRSADDYRTQQRGLAAAWKSRTSDLPPEARASAPYVVDGEPRGHHDFCLPVDYAELTLLPPVRTGALALMAELGVPWHAGTPHGPSNHLLDSQVQCVNALFPMVSDPARILAAFGAALDTEEVLEIEPGRFLTFEYIGPVDYFNEGNGKPRRRGTRCTSVDAAFRYLTRQGEVELALLEWKYTESYPSLRKPQPKADATRSSRYQAHYEDDSGPLRSELLDFPFLLDEPFYQLMRQQLLAHQLETHHAEDAAAVRVIHVLSPSNLAYQRSLARDEHRALGSTVDEVWHRLLRQPDRFIRLDPGVFLDAAITSTEYVDRYGPAALVGS